MKTIVPTEKLMKTILLLTIKFPLYNTIIGTGFQLWRMKQTFSML